MKKRYLLLLISVALALSACSGHDPEPTKTKPAPDIGHVQTQPKKTRQDPDAVCPTGQLLCSVESREEAETLAECYGITLVSYSNGLAVFYTEEDPRDVIQRGRDNGWPELSRNVVRYFS